MSEAPIQPSPSVEVSPQSPSIEAAPTPEMEAQPLPKAFQGSDYASMRERAIQAKRPFIALFTDVDRTFYVEERRDKSDLLFAQAKSRNIPINAVTGRGIEDMKQMIEIRSSLVFQLLPLR